MWCITLISPLDCKEIQSVHPKGDQSWVFTGRTYVESENPILWPPDGKSWLIWKDPDAGKDWRQDEKGKTEDEMVGWHHRFNGDREALYAAVHGVTKIRTWLSDWSEPIQFQAFTGNLGILPWKIRKQEGVTVSKGKHRRKKVKNKLRVSIICEIISRIQIFV